jgi:hypothetical protein
MRFNDEILARVMEEALSHGASLKLFDGPEPETCNDPDPGRCLAELIVPEKSFEKVNNGDGREVLRLTTPWRGVGTAAAGKGRLCRSWRVYDNTRTFVVVQGSAGANESPVDMHFSNPSMREGREVKIDQMSFVTRWLRPGEGPAEPPPPPRDCGDEEFYTEPRE